VVYFLAIWHDLDQRLGLSPLLNALKQSRPADYLSPLNAPPISPGHIALLLIATLVLSGLGLTFFYSPRPSGPLPAQLTVNSPQILLKCGTIGFNDLFQWNGPSGKQGLILQVKILGRWRK